MLAVLLVLVVVAAMDPLTCALSDTCCSRRLFSASTSSFSRVIRWMISANRSSSTETSPPTVSACKSISTAVSPPVSVSRVRSCVITLSLFAADTYVGRRREMGRGQRVRR